MTPAIPVIAAPAPTAPTISSIFSNPAAALAGLQTGIKLNLAGTLPGEELLAKMVEAWQTQRTTMDPDIRRRFDLILIQQWEDLQHLWRGIFVAMGVLK